MKELFEIPSSSPVLAPVRCADVALALPLENIFSYSIPPECEPQIKPGVRVRVPFRNREMIGYIVGQRIMETSSKTKLKPIIQVLDDIPVLSEPILKLTHRISEYYGSSWGEAIENALPKWVKFGKSAEKALAKELKEPAGEYLPAKDLKLTSEQQAAFDILLARLEEPGKAKPVLLFGVTGSGKSEIYIRLIREVLKKGKTAICLVPEIALTEQIKRFFYQHFGDYLEILHSKLSDSERFLAWKRLEQGRKKVVLGPRSAVFAPLPNLGLLIMDEEHENTYKQETTPRYHAREAAIWRAEHEKALFVMGSATPSLETMRRAETNEFERLDLKNRVDDKPLPQVQLIDLKLFTGGKKRPTILSPKMITEIQNNLTKKEGTMLLLNRRGFATHINCPKCGSIETCPSCQVSLTFHQEDENLLCHYCNFHKPVPDLCSQCQTPVLRFAGFGTEKVESEVAALFPQARIARMDADSVKKKGSHEVILKSFREKTIDILIGTQMIAKGFDFPHVTLVGVILADVGLMLPDFRSAERTFQLLTQVAGRAGRGTIPGRVLVQTFSPDHPSVRFAKDHDYLNFYKHETRERYEYRYPPYSQLMNIIIRSKIEKEAYLYAKEVRDNLQKAFGIEPGPSGSSPKPIELIGPAPLPFYKLRGHFRWHVMIKTLQPAEDLSVKVRQSLAQIKKKTAVAVALDRDPLNIL